MPRTTPSVQSSRSLCLRVSLLFGVVLSAGAATAADGGITDGGSPALVADAGSSAPDAGPSDAGPAPIDAGPAPIDAGPGTVDDAGPPPVDPPVWTCDPAYYDADDGCDCECGIPDPDCALANPSNPTVYGCPPEVGCSELGYCEIPGCGDGTVDDPLELCDDGNTEPYDGCTPSCRPEPGYSCTADPTSCIPVPEGWDSDVGPYCVDSRYGDGELCDCGCGVVDLDCADQTATCDGLPLGCIPAAAIDEDGELDTTLLTTVPDLADNTRCVGNVCGDTWTAGEEECDDGNTEDGDLCSGQCVIETPAGWTCDPVYVLDDECDCGCGAPDPACPGLALDPEEDCAFDECRGPHFVDPDDHSQCLPRDAVDEADAGPEPDPHADAGAPAADAGPEEPAPDCANQQVRGGPAPGASLAALAVVAFLFGRPRRGARQRAGDQLLTP